MTTHIDPSADRLGISVVVLAKDEEDTIAHCLRGIRSQSIFDDATIRTEVLVVANGCGDQTAARATAYLEQAGLPPHCSFRVVDVPEPGKSRAWNLAVHDLISAQSRYYIFADSDIDFLDEAVLARMIEAAQNDDTIAAYAGRPVKKNESSARRSLVERFSSLISRKTQFEAAICGQLYLIRAEVAALIWLPNETPGEDGFLNAMVETEGFSQRQGLGLVRGSDRITHYFEDISIRQFFAHERRMVTGTVINNWLFEHLHAMEMRHHGGAAISDWNVNRPDWVQKVIDARVRGRRWVVPAGVVLRRFGSVAASGLPRFVLRAPLAIAATVLSLPSIIAANQALKRRGVASQW